MRVEPSTSRSPRLVPSYTHDSSFMSLAEILDLDSPRKEAQVEQGKWGLVPSRLWEGEPRRDQRTPGPASLSRDWVETATFQTGIRASSG